MMKFFKEEEGTYRELTECKRHGVLITSDLDIDRTKHLEGLGNLALEI
jgi:hypothetical protein